MCIDLVRRFKDEDYHGQVWYAVWARMDDAERVAEHLRLDLDADAQMDLARSRKLVPDADDDELKKLRAAAIKEIGGK